MHTRFLSLLGLVLAVGCEGGGTGALFCPFDYSGPVDSQFGDPPFDELLEATARFQASANDLDTTVRGACNAINTDLGAATSTDTATACQNASTAIDAIVTANASATLTVAFLEPTCEVDARVVADCAARCDASFDVMATPPRCEGGELSGTCSGTCSGQCTVEGDVECSGSCSGSCQGSCDLEVRGACTGTCTGQCEGECSATAEDGSCAGECTGTCTGRCEGTIDGSCAGSCEGMCQGSCRADVEASCEGRCTGGCDVMFEEPRCEGGELVVDADVDCRAACEADASFQVTCQEPELIITFEGDVADLDSLEALIATLEANLPTLIAALRKARVVAEATLALGRQLDDAASSAARIGVDAADCLRLAVEAQVAAAAKVSVSVEVSVMVSASASVSG